MESKGLDEYDPEAAAGGLAKAVVRTYIHLQVPTACWKLASTIICGLSCSIYPSRNSVTIDRHQIDFHAPHDVHFPPLLAIGMDHSQVQFVHFFSSALSSL